jgi:molybdate transport system substrate-binding protein
MRSTKLKTAAAAGISAALSAVCAPAAHADFTIGVAANFSDEVQNIISLFQAANNGQYSGVSVNVLVDSTADIKTCIVTSNATNCQGYTSIDLFLSADKATPLALTSKAMIQPSGATVSTAPFFYADGSLVFWSATQSSATSGLPASIPADFVIADPSKAPYGFAAMTILQESPYNLTSLATTLVYPPTTFGGAYTHVYTAPNILQTYQQVLFAGPSDPQYGFVAKSFVCTRAPGSTVQSIANYGTEYVYTNGSTPTYSAIIQYGLPVESGQTDTVKNQVLAFVAFLQGTVARYDMNQVCYDFSIE